MLEAFKLIVPDVLKEVDDLVAVSRHGRSHRFRWTADPSWSGYDVEMLLRQWGVYCYNRGYTDSNGKDYSIMVRKRQAAWAQYILEGAGVPLTGGWLRRKTPVTQLPKKRWGTGVKPADVMGWVLGLFDRQENG